MSSVDLNMGAIGGTTLIKTIFSFIFCTFQDKLCLLQTPGKKLKNKVFDSFFSMEKTAWRYVPVGTIFQLCGAPPYFSRRFRTFLDKELPDRRIGRGGIIPWPPRSPDLIPLYFSSSMCYNPLLFSWSMLLSEGVKRSGFEACWTGHSNRRSARSVPSQFSMNKATEQLLVFCNVISTSVDKMRQYYLVTGLHQICNPKEVSDATSLATVCTLPEATSRDFTQNMAKFFWDELESVASL